ncbi:MAG: arylsulfatase [Phycisphaeraceae bacterium]
MRTLITCLIFLTSFAPPSLAAEVKPNIIYIMVDDAGLGDFGPYGGKVVPTPNVDKLAREGMLFTNAYSGSAVCAPTRCVLMTGMHTGHCTRRANASKNGLIALRADQVTLAEPLKKAGYATAGFGKWALGNPGTTGVPEAHGFDLFYGYYDQTHAHNYFPAFLVRNSKEEALKGGNGVSGKAGKSDTYAVDMIMDEMIAFIEKNKGKPFFVYGCWTLPHGNFEIPSDEPFSNKPWPQPVKNHAAMIARLDRDLGTVMAKLKELKLDEKTLVIFSSDNGASGPGVKTFNSSGDLRGLKRSLYEGGIRMPLIARWPGKVKAGSTSDLLTSHVDAFATLCDLAGAPKPKKTDGISILPTLLGATQSTKHESLYWEIYEGPAPFQQAVRMGNWKGYRTALKGPLELYDLSKDAAEANDVAKQHADVVKRIEAIMEAEHVTNPNWDPIVNLGDKRKGKK